MTPYQPSPEAVELPCGYVFAISGGSCMVGPDHPVHIGGWTGPEPRHDYEPKERRSGNDRRAARTPSQPDLAATAQRFYDMLQAESEYEGVLRVLLREPEAKDLAAALASQPAPAAVPAPASEPDPFPNESRQSLIHRIELLTADLAAAEARTPSQPDPDAFIEHARSIAWQEAAPVLNGIRRPSAPSQPDLREALDVALAALRNIERVVGHSWVAFDGRTHVLTWAREGISALAQPAPAAPEDQP